MHRLPRILTCQDRSGRLSNYTTPVAESDAWSGLDGYLESGCRDVDMSHAGLC